MTDASQGIAYLWVEHDGRESVLVAPVGAVLRDVLLANGISPYTRVTEHLNCSGRGLCATCGVRFVSERSSESDGAESDADEEPSPEHWHDSFAARFGYPRLSCQIDVEGDMSLRIPEKIVWGSRRAGNGSDYQRDGRC